MDTLLSLRASIKRGYNIVLQGNSSEGATVHSKTPKKKKKKKPCKLAIVAALYNNFNVRCVVNEEEKYAEIE